MSIHPKILVIDSDPAIHRLLGLILEANQCRVISAKTGEEGLSRAMSEAFDLIVLELELPGSVGLTVLNALLGSCRTPVMILSACDGVGETVAALDAGACDYVLKPFNGAELAARGRVQLRARKATNANIFIGGPPGRSPSSQGIFVNGLRLDLTEKEEAVLRILASQPGSLVGIDQILREVWGSDGLAQLHELRVYITRLRRKLETCGAPNLIESERNVGYILSLGAARDLPAAHSSSDALGTAHP